MLQVTSLRLLTLGHALRAHDEQITKRPFMWHGDNYLLALPGSLDFLQRVHGVCERLGFGLIRNPFVVPADPPPLVLPNGKVVRAKIAHVHGLSMLKIREMEQVSVARGGRPCACEVCCAPLSRVDSECVMSTRVLGMWGGGGAGAGTTQLVVDEEMRSVATATCRRRLPVATSRNARALLLPATSQVGPVGVLQRDLLLVRRKVRWAQ